MDTTIPDKSAMSSTRPWLVSGLLAAVLFQVVILVSEWGVAHYPLWQGTEIRLRVTPVDPRDLFRGNYARLGYSLSRLPLELADTELQRADVVYVSLQKDEVGEWQASAISSRMPASGLFLRARVESVDIRGARFDSVIPRAGVDDQRQSLPMSRGSYRLRYGIEALFAPKEKAMALERSFRADSHWAVVKVSANGRSALVDVLADE